jgi:hypothetical protein
MMMKVVGKNLCVPPDTYQETDNVHYHHCNEVLRYTPLLWLHGIMQQLKLSLQFLVYTVLHFNIWTLWCELRKSIELAADNNLLDYD